MRRKLGPKLYLLLFAILLCYYCSAQQMTDSIRQSWLHRMPLRPAVLGARSNTGVQKFLAKTLLNGVGTTTAGKGKILDFTGALCQDTTKRLLLGNDTLDIYNGYISQTKDGNFLIAGNYYLVNSVAATTPFIVKCSPNGTVLWCRSFYGVGIYPANGAQAYRAQELNNGDILMVGSILIPETSNGRNELALWRLTGTGNLIWAKSYASTTWTDPTSGQCYITGIGEDATGNLYLAGEQDIYSAPTVYSFIFKLTSVGTAVWDEDFQYGEPIPFGLVVQSGRIVLIGSFESVYTEPNVSTNLIYAVFLDPVTGTPLDAKGWYANYAQQSFWNSFTPFSYVTAMNNGNIVISGSTNQDFIDWATGIAGDTVNHCIAATFDADFNFLSGTIFSSHYASNYNQTMITTDPEGKISYCRTLGLGSNSTAMIYGSAIGSQIIKERIYHEKYIISFNSNFLHTGPDEDVSILQVADTLTYQGYMELVRQHNSDTSGFCTGNDTALTFTQPYSMIIKPGFSTAYCNIVSNTFSETHRNFAPDGPLPLTANTACHQISFCDSIGLHSANDTTCVGTTLLFHYSKNPECGAKAIWTFDTTAVASFSFPNDSSIDITYKKAWEGYVYASMTATCGNLLMDSVAVWIKEAPGPVSLGPDSAICNGDSLLLNAHSGYSSYNWQDGTLDSVYLVKNPGTYWVKTTDICNNVYRDTVVVKDTLFFFSAGRDTTVCTGNSIHLQATGGFSGYQWYAADGILPGATDSGEQVAPYVDTRYFISARRGASCPVKDSVEVEVLAVPSVFLGNDTSICADDSLLLNAGNGFAGYSWSTGSSSPAIIANQAGLYWVKVTAGDGCTTSDTMKITHVYPLPSFRLSNTGDTILCAGSQIYYSFNLPGAAYLWNDGSATIPRVIDKAGTYWLAINQNGCVKSDTVNVHVQALPVVVFPGDTMLCEGQSLLLDATNPGGMYRWQDGSTTPEFLVTESGIYSVEVSLSGCDTVFSDTIAYILLPNLP